MRQSARSDAKQYLDAAEGNTEPLTDILGSEGATRGSKHTEIKVMVRDILFKDIIDKEHDAEMAYVDEVINGICNATDSVIGSGDASTPREGEAASTDLRCPVFGLKEVSEDKAEASSPVAPLQGVRFQATSHHAEDAGGSNTSPSPLHLGKLPLSFVFPCLCLSVLSGLILIF